MPIKQNVFHPNLFHAFFIPQISAGFKCRQQNQHGLPFFHGINRQKAAGRREEGTARKQLTVSRWNMAAKQSTTLVRMIVLCRLPKTYNLKHKTLFGWLRRLLLKIMVYSLIAVK
jgi:hypothetical protein